jgi:hypothetical protein
MSRQLEWAYSLGGSAQPAIVEYTEDDSQTFVVGDPVRYDASEGAVELAVVGTVSAIGIAQRAGTNVTSGNVEIPVALFRPDDVWSATISAAGADSAAVHALTNLYDQYGWIKSTETGQTANVTVNQSNVTNQWFRPIALDGRDAAGTSGGRVLFLVVPAVYDDPAV